LKGIEAILRGLQASENLDDPMQDACSVLSDVIDEIEMEIRKVVEQEEVNFFIQKLPDMLYNIKV
ncbi:MAG: hypothetical protein MR016_08390, partial [Agathobacter sp.]|nr:hypothetical protein [Agathobacter sp.]